MNSRRFSEKDWKIFRSKLAVWQESFMDRLNKEYIELLSGDGAASDKFSDTFRESVKFILDGRREWEVDAT